MTFRTRLLAIFVMTVVLAVGLVSWTVAATARRAFERVDNARSAALVGQFQREFAARGAEVTRRLFAIAEAPLTLRMAVELNRPEFDPAPYVDEAQAIAAAQGLNLLEFVAEDGTIISSAQWPARFGYKEEWVANAAIDWRRERPFLKREQLSDREALALVAVATVNPGGKKLYVIGGEEINQQFLASLVLPAGMRVLLYRETSTGMTADERKLAPIIEQVRRERREVTRTVDGPDGDPETFHAIPLMGRENNLLGALLVGSSRHELAELIRFIRKMAFVLGGAGTLLGFVLAWWATARVTGPVQRLAEGARKVAAGNWHTRVDVASADEIGELARAFNLMTQQLIEQRDRLIQTERVAAWRELARRLAHELKNPLFPLQITVENMQRARDLHPEQFEEVFRESAATLLTELANLKQIIGRFSDFAKMPPPELQAVNVNGLVRRTMSLFGAQLRAPGHPSIEPKLELGENIPDIQADPEQLGRALGNLVLNAIDAMPKGGVLTVRTARNHGAVRLEISDTGEGLTKEECERLFTPYYTTKSHGTGLGLAIVQSVVSDHHGRISVESEPGQGTTFRIEL
jgi:two-component system nitrogen regulation sensor histidine kinase NtrY